jgi:Fe-S cluster assembly protein SufD
MELNNTPLRTSNNFNINSINLDVNIPQNIKKFANIQVTKKIEELKENLEFKYGVGLDYSNSNNDIKINLNNNDNVKLVYNFDNENNTLINQILINANGNSTITIEYLSNTNKECFHNGAIKLIANENAKVNINIVNFLNEASNNFETIENKLYKNSNVNYTIIDIGGQKSISNYYSSIIGENATNNVKTIYLGCENQIKDLNYIAELYGKKTNIDIDVQGAITGKAKKHFKGTIDFKKGCKKAKGNENEYCMILSEDAKAIALPMLLCSEEDVEGNHSTASGKVDKKILFYIMSRGLSYKESVTLLVKSNFSKIIESIKDEELKKTILKKIDEKIN